MDGGSLLDSGSAAISLSQLNPFDEPEDLNGIVPAQNQGQGSPAEGQTGQPFLPLKDWGPGRFDEIELADSQQGETTPTAHVDSDWKRSDSSLDSSPQKDGSNSAFGDTLETSGVLLVSLGLVVQAVEGPQGGSVDPLPADTRAKIERVGMDAVRDALLELDPGGEGTVAAGDVWTAIEHIIQAGADAGDATPTRGGATRRALENMVRAAKGGAAAVKHKVAQPDAFLGSRRLKKMGQVLTDVNQCKEGKVFMGSRRLGEMRVILGKKGSGSSSTAS